MSSRKLFCNKEGQAIEFMVRKRCPTRESIENKITKYGGKVVDHAGDYTISIGLPDDKNFSASIDTFTTKFLDECIEKNTLVNPMEYLLTYKSYFNSYKPMDIAFKNKKWSELQRISVSDSESEEEPSNHNRRLYTIAEDKMIIQYLIDNDEMERVTGSELWKDMETAKACGIRTWESMRNRFRRHIVYDIGKFTSLERSHLKILRKKYPQAEIQVPPKSTETTNNLKRKRSTESGRPRKKRKANPTERDNEL